MDKTHIVNLHEKSFFLNNRRYLLHDIAALVRPYGGVRSNSRSKSVIKIIAQQHQAMYVFGISSMPWIDEVPRVSMAW